MATDHKYPLIKETNDTQYVPLCLLTALWRKTLGWTYRETRMKKVSAFVWRNGNVISAEKFARENTQCRNASPAIQLRPIKTGKERMRANVIGASRSERGAAESLRLKHMMAQISHKPAP